VSDITLVMEQDTGSAWYRLRVPGEALEAVGHNVTYATDVVPVAPTTVFLRPARAEAVGFIADIVKRGRVAIVELDDDMWSIARHNPAYGYWNANGGEMLRNLEGSIRAASGVTVTTDALAATIRPMNANVVVLPNMLPPGWAPAPEHESVTIGWGGSSTHRADVALVADALVYASRSADVALIGAMGDWTPYSPRIAHWAPVTIPEMPALLSGFDIGIAPLVDSRFNRAKSDLKVLEYAACSIPVIASPRYRDTPARIASNYKEWCRHIDALVSSPELRKVEGARMKAWADTRVMADHVGRWEAAWSLTR